MRILHVCNRLTCRVWKEAYVLQRAGHEVIILFNQMAMIGLDQSILYLSRWVTGGDLVDKITAIAPDVVHMHTSLSQLQIVDFVRESGAPCVWDVHDWSADVAALADGADCEFIVPNNGIAAHLGRGAVVYSKVPAALITPEARAAPSQPRNPETIVLASHVSTAPAWRDYRPIQQRFWDAGLMMWIYPTDRNQQIGEYDRLMQTLPYVNYLNELTFYGWGYAGAANADHTIHDCVTNKFWEYLAAGIPVITYRSDEMTELAESMGVGVDLDWLDMDRLRSAKYRERFAREIANQSDALAMEGELPILQAVYSSITKKRVY